MTKYLIAASVAAMFAVSPAFAAGKIKCNAGTMHKIEMMTKEAMADKKMEKMAHMAMEESDMAMKAKESGDYQGCRDHLKKAEMSLMDHG